MKVLVLMLFACRKKKRGARKRKGAYLIEKEVAWPVFEAYLHARARVPSL